MEVVLEVMLEVMVVDRVSRGLPLNVSRRLLNVYDGMIPTSKSRHPRFCSATPRI
jgi:hypothetical protein